MRARSASSPLQGDFASVLASLEGEAHDFFRPVAGVERLWADCCCDGYDTISEGSVRKSYSARAEIRPSPEGFPRDFVFADREAILRKPYDAATIASAYAEHQPEIATITHKIPDFGEIAADIVAARSAEELYRLRRALALAAHPDRVPTDARADAERLMARVNAAIDEALARERVR